MTNISHLVRRGPPRLGVVYDLGSASLATIRAAAGRAIDLVFICDRDLPHVRDCFSQAAQYARVLDVTGLSWEERVEAVNQLSLAGIVTLSEYRLMDVARLCAALNLPGHSPGLVERLTDKFVQRTCLAEAGVQRTSCVELTIRPGHDDWQTELAEMTFPAVLKPRSGAGSLNTVRVDSLEQLSIAVQALGARGAYVLESYLEGDTQIAGHAWGDYVSVESVHTPAGSQQLCVTGKFPLSPPFRETGMVLPSTLGQADIDRVLSLEAAAIQALGVRHGITHTEIKLTAQGPRIIEVNGRLGGYVPEILKRASGVNLVRCAMDVALGQTPHLSPLSFDGVHYQYFLTPPQATCGALQAIHGLEAIADMAGVLQIEVRAAEGDWINCMSGTQSLLGIVYGEADDHQQLEQRISSIAANFRPEFHPANEPFMRMQNYEQ